MPSPPPSWHGEEGKQVIFAQTPFPDGYPKVHCPQEPKRDGEGA